MTPAIASYLAGMVSGAVLVWGYFAVTFTRPARTRKPGTPAQPEPPPRHRRAPLRNEWDDDGRTSFTVPPAPDDATAPIIRNRWGHAHG